MSQHGISLIYPYPSRSSSVIPITSFLLLSFSFSSLLHPFVFTITGESENYSKPPHKAYDINNIKTYVPLILDLITHNYEPWSDLFKAHFIASNVLDHIDETYNPPNKAPMYPGWENLIPWLNCRFSDWCLKALSRQPTLLKQSLANSGSTVTLSFMTTKSQRRCN